jgi:hypothetical protein
MNCKVNTPVPVLRILAAILLCSVISLADVVQDEWVEDPLTVPFELVISGTWQGDLTWVSPSGNVNSVNHSTCTQGFLAGYGFFSHVPYQKFSISVYGNTVSSVHISLDLQFAGLLAKRGSAANAPIFKLLVDGEEKSDWTETNPPGCTSFFSKTYEIEIRPDSGPRPVNGGEDDPWNRAERNLSRNDAIGEAGWAGLGPGKTNATDRTSVPSEHDSSANVGRQSCKRCVPGAARCGTTDGKVEENESKSLLKKACSDSGVQSAQLVLTCTPSSKPRA